MSLPKSITKSVSPSRSLAIEVTPEVLARINQHTAEPYPAEKLYVRRLLAAHNAIDRDVERFSEGVIQKLARTTPGKLLLLDHARKATSAIGKFFDAGVLTVPLVEARALLGEPDLQLPAGMDEVTILEAYAYVPTDGVDEKTLNLMKAGVYSFVSVGVSADRLVPISTTEGTILYHEYQGNAEIREISIVYLGAQPGAAMKEAKGGQEPASPEKSTTTTQEGGEKMEEFIKQIGIVFGKSIETAEAAIAEAKAMAKALVDRDEKIATLEPLAAMGKAYKGGLCTEYVRLKRLAGDCGDTPEDVARTEKFATSMDIEMLRAEIKAIEPRAREKHPTEFRIPEKSGERQPGDVLDAATARKFALVAKI